MWKIYEHKRVVMQLRALPIEVLKRYEKWKDILLLSGSNGLKLIRGLKDEALSGKWKGFRSSRLNDQYRVIYRIDHDQIYVSVMNVTPHDYRKK